MANKDCHDRAAQREREEEMGNTNDAHVLQIETGHGDYDLSEGEDSGEVEIDCEAEDEYVISED